MWSIHRDRQPQFLPKQDAAFHVYHAEPLAHEEGGGSVAASATATINIIGAGCVEAFHALFECVGVEPVEVLGTSQMTLGKLLGPPHVEQQGGAVGGGSRHERAWLQHAHAVLRVAVGTQPQRGKERQDDVLHVGKVTYYLRYEGELKAVF